MAMQKVGRQEFLEWKSNNPDLIGMLAAICEPPQTHWYAGNEWGKEELLARVVHEDSGDEYHLNVKDNIETQTT